MRNGIPRIRQATAGPLVLVSCGASILLGGVPSVGGALHGQDPRGGGSVAVRVVDPTAGEPVEGVLLTIRAVGVQGLTNGEGHYRFEEIPTGSHELEASHLGYAPRTISFDVSSGETLNLRVLLQARAIELDPIGVEVERRPPRLRDVGYYERRERGWGTFFDPSWVESRNRGFARLSQLVNYVETSATAPPSCQMRPVYLDGRRIRAEPAGSRGRGAGNNVLADLSSGDVGAIEVYSDGHGVPIFALNDTTLTCGAVVMWSNRWDEREVGISTRPEPHESAKALCEPARLTASEGGTVIEGMVRDAATGVPLPGARVVLTLDTGGNSIEIETTADPTGRYRFCRGPREGPVTLRPAYGDFRGRPAVIGGEDVEARERIERDLEIALDGP